MSLRTLTCSKKTTKGTRDDRDGRPGGEVEENADPGDQDGGRAEVEEDHANTEQGRRLLPPCDTGAQEQRSRPRRCAGGGGHEDDSNDCHGREESDAAPPTPRKEVGDVPAQDDTDDSGPGGEPDAAAPAVRKQVDDDVSKQEDTNDSPGQEPDAAPPALRMDVASCFVPDHGEDAHFTLPDAGVIGVADGVGSYRHKGVDASAFARALMKNAQAEAELATTKPVCPHTLLRTAYDAAARSRTPGASTAVILALDGGAAATLRWAFVGDSGFAVFRGSKIVHRSAQQRERFNCPSQLSTRGRSGGIHKADVGGVAVRAGDVVVAGTDGLWDNVSDKTLEWYVEKGWSPQRMAKRIAGYASTKVARKVDDITVVVAFIVASGL
ncbi:hypothetical protein PR202_ga02080 [Eleusine coracana subsp. coracana]|uniref:Protein phosphatase n=1 Tax=Eleusine coracana subsp. coracana TaxID=191504 RepID=A0AAV5BKE0_ELECO|nr:hypothetical protein PR202_ga01393 [Eleusine coracana subsp. coracana]GJM86239.1 hypothetical protein PR202_ga02080 [Eleusine coracana subsp. coracana]